MTGSGVGPEEMVREDRLMQATPRKQPQTEGGSKSNQSQDHEPILPPPVAAYHPPRGQAIDIKAAVAAKLRRDDQRIASGDCALPVLDEVKRKMFQDWLRGLDMRVLRNNYRDPVLGTPKLKPIEAVMREEARRENSELRRFLQERKAA